MHIDDTSKRNIRWYTFLPCPGSQLNIQSYVLPSRWWIDPSCTFVHFAFYRTVTADRTRAWRISSIFTRACVGTSHSCQTPIKWPENGRDSYVNGLHDGSTARTCDSYMVTRRLHGLTLTRFRTSHTVAVDK